MIIQTDVGLRNLEIIIDGNFRNFFPISGLINKYLLILGNRCYLKGNLIHLTIVLYPKRQYKRD